MFLSNRSFQKRSKHSRFQPQTQENPKTFWGKYNEETRWLPGIFITKKSTKKNVGFENKPWL